MNKDLNKLIKGTTDLVKNQLKVAYIWGRNDGKWIPVNWHEITEEERERDGLPKDWLTYMDCEMPEDGQEILITTKRGIVEKDICYHDDCYSLDSGYDWIEDVLAWMPLPKPYREDGAE